MDQKPMFHCFNLTTKATRNHVYRSLSVFIFDQTKHKEKQTTMPATNIDPPNRGFEIGSCWTHYFHPTMGDYWIQAAFWGDSIWENIFATFTIIVGDIPSPQLSTIICKCYPNPMKSQSEMCI